MDGQIGSLPNGSTWELAAERRGDSTWIQDQWQSPDSLDSIYREGNSTYRIPET